MPIAQHHRAQIESWYCIGFYGLFLFKCSAGLLLVQLQPILFNNRFDLFTWLIMETGLHQWLMAGAARLLLFDILFYSMPLLYWIVSRWRRTSAPAMAIAMLLINWMYIQCYTLYPANSIESFTAWLLFPLLFISIDLKTFYFLLHGLRYFFLYFFVSAGIWKIVQGGAFNTEQMSGILLYQHKEYLVSSPLHWFSKMIYWLVAHPALSYLLYLAALVLELFFAVGFFTRKFDRLLIAAYVLFLLMDLLLMRIYYWETIPFLLTLVFSRHVMPLRRA